MTPSSWPPRRPLARDLAAAVLPAYLFPFATSFPGALVTGDPALRAASTTLIPIPGALAAAVVVLATRALAARLPAATRIAPARAALVGLAACGAAGLAVLGSLIHGGVLPAAALGYAAPSAAVGGGITALVWARRRARAQAAPPSAPPRAAVLALVAIALAAGACGPALPRLAVGRSSALVATGPDAATFRAVADACRAWVSAADDEIAGGRRSQTRAGATSAVAGTLGTLAGVATAVLSATADTTDDSARIGQVGGAVALGLGAIAGLAGMRASAQGHRVAATLHVGVALERAIRERAERVLAAPPGSAREAIAQHESTGLAIDCAAAAQRLPRLADLPLAADAPPRVARAFALLRGDAAPGSRELRRRVAQALAGAEVAR